MRIVGIGASAGGIEALKEFLTHLPPETGAAYVVVQHLAPDIKSIMDDLLRKYTKMPIVVLRKDQPISPNHVYLLPGDYMLTYEYGLLKLHQRDQAPGLHLPIDRFFHSLGNHLKKEAVVVVMSGSGTDGSRGARTVKEQGGIVLVQDPATATFDGMPKALIRLDIADEILSPDQLARKAARILRLSRRQRSARPSVTQSPETDIEQTWFKKILDVIELSSGIRFSDYKVPTLYRRMEKRTVLHELNSLEEYYDVLKDDQDEQAALFKDFLINVTRFFRDRAVFECLADNYLEKILDGLEPGQPCRVWVPACSTGEEAYTIAILIAEHIRKHKLDVDFKIFASDVSKKSIALATRGLYSDSISSDVPSDLLSRYFIHHTNEYEVKQVIREKVIFAPHNVISDPPFIRMRLISCRNLLIYLSNEAQNNVLRTFFFALHPHAHLLLGPSESLGELRSVFTQPLRGVNIYRKLDEDNMSLRQSYTPPSNLWLNKTSPVIEFVTNPPNVMPPNDNYRDPFSTYLLERYCPSVIFVNENLDVLYLNGDLERYLRLPRAVARLNLEKMMDHKNGLLFRDGVRVAMSSDKRHVYNHVVFTRDGEETPTRVFFQRLQIEVLEQPIVLIEITQEEPINEPVSEEVTITESDLINEKILRLENTLRDKKQAIADLTDKMDLTAEELNTSNRELLASNEELQSTNEELQSVNEELHTVNAELQYKNEELTVSSNDISNLLKSTDIGTIFLDTDLRIRKFTPAIRRQFDLIRSDINRPITAFANNLIDVDLEHICRRVYETRELYEDQVSDREGREFLLRVLPYHTEEDKIGGCVITLVEITEVVKAKRENLDLAVRFAAILEATDIPVLFLKADGTISQINRPLPPFTAEQLAGRNIFEVLGEEQRKKLRTAFDAVMTERKTRSLQMFIPSAEAAHGHHYQLRIIPIGDDARDSSPVSVVIAALEVTSMLQQQRELEATLEIYSSFMKNAHHQIALIDRDGIIVDLNYTQHSSKTPEQLIGRSVYEMIPASEIAKYKASVKEIFDGGSKSEINFLYVDQHGEELEVTLIATPVVVNQEITFVALIGTPIAKT